MIQEVGLHLEIHCFMKPFLPTSAIKTKPDKNLEKDLQIVVSQVQSKT